MKNALGIICFLLVFLSCGKKAGDSAYMEYAVDTAMVACAAIDEDAMPLNEPPQQKSGLPAPTIEKKIIRTADISISSKDIYASKHTVDSLLKKLDGYYDSENFSNSYSLSYSLKIRIPSVHFDAFINGLGKGTDKITEKDITARDVTAQYIDLQSRIETKRVYLNRYNELAKKAKTVEDILKIEEQSRVIIEEIESSEKEFRYLSKQIALSTIEIYISQEKEYTPKETPSFGKQLLSALENGWYGLKGLFFFLITIWPLYLFIPLIIFLAKRIKLKKKKKNKKS